MQQFKFRTSFFHAFSGSGFLPKIRKAILVELVLLAGVLTFGMREQQAVTVESSSTGQNYIKWVDFTVSYEALCRAYDWDVDTHDTEHEVNWIDLLAYTAARTGGEFDKKALDILDDTAKQLSDGETTIEKLTGDMIYFTYYK